MTSKLDKENYWVFLSNTKRYFDLFVTIRRYKGTDMWVFDIEQRNGKNLMFRGAPNICESRRSAFRRAWWRCKWINDGTFDNRYVK